MDPGVGIATPMLAMVSTTNAVPIPNPAVSSNANKAKNVMHPYRAQIKTLKTPMTKNFFGCLRKRNPSRNECKRRSTVLPKREGRIRVSIRSRRSVQSRRSISVTSRVRKAAVTIPSVTPAP